MTALTIQDMHDMIGWIKNQYQSGEQEPEQIDRALNSASTDKFNEEKRLFEKSGYISGNLRKFKTSASITIAAGLGSLPADYEYATNASYNDVEVEIIPEGEWVNRKTDPIDTPSSAYPICAIRDQVEIFPAALTPLKLYYLRRPATMVFGYTPSGNDYIYDSGSSVSCDWPASCHVDIVLRAMPYLGLPLNDDMMVKLKNYKKTTENV